MSTQIVRDNAIILVSADGEEYVRATCADHESALKAAKLMERAAYANDVKRQYTKAARLLASCNELSGFAWTD